MTQHSTKFYNLSREERLKQLKQTTSLNQEDIDAYLHNSLLAPDVANALIENQISQFALPMGVALNFKMNGKKYVVPMVVEEPSVIAAASHAAKLFNKNGFTATSAIKGMIGQIILKEVQEPQKVIAQLQQQETTIYKMAEIAHPSIVKRGGGLKNIEYRIVKNPKNNHDYLTLHLIIDTLDAMGANIVNTILEGVTPLIESISGHQALLSILSNYNTESLVTATCRVPIEQLASQTKYSSEEIAKRLIEANNYAKLDPYRAATHNKGIMNGIDSLVIATGNDPRAVEAGIQAYAARNGSYQCLTEWFREDDDLIGKMTLPLSIGTVGGAISVLPLAKTNLKLLTIKSADELAQLIVSVGLAQNFAALRALVTDGIQKGHMNLHASSLAIQVGAVNQEITQLTGLLRQEKTMNTEIAKDLLQRIRKTTN
ncbi:hydroxymethylglutaryl-CoA reductase, degradative [Vagococcus sp.]|uniref:hydroxymethylglutaryl-CoA reductase, degradative n=1 Tax=Vagococcus sp. TaxID=1933889 RepID=UPI003F95D186